MSDRKSSEELDLQPVSDSLLSVIPKNPILFKILNLDMSLAWAYVIFEGYFEITFIRNAFLSLLGTLGGILDAIFSVAAGCLFYIFLIVLIIQFARSNIRISRCFRVL